ncbi:hypothetical protein LEN26_013567 [Aphanomyces euteiches]|nr:hypothetical protein LEN26_013567 [Aphanomyces euteiches]
MRAAKQTALHENEKLRQELEENIQFAKALQAIMTKQPKRTMLPTTDSDQWQVFKLVKDPLLRHRAMHEIPQAMYELTESAMVESGLADRVDDFESCIPSLSKTTSDLVLNITFCSTKHFDFNVVSEMAWKLFDIGYGSKELSFKVHEKIDYNSAYIKYNKRWNSTPSQANVLYKRVMEPERDVIVCRTVLEDELHPIPEGVLVMNKSAWVVLEKLDNGEECRIKFFQKSTLPMIQASADGKSHLDSDAWYQYYRIGNVSECAMQSLKTIVSDFDGAITTLLAHYNGDVDETFRRVIAMLDLEASIYSAFTTVTQMDRQSFIFFSRLIYQWDSPQTVDTTSSDGAQSQSDHEKPTSLVESAPRKQVNTSRKRQREEIEYLRSKVEELEQHLKILKEVRGLDIGNESPWQETANRMRVAKQNALHENERLKHELEEHIQFGKALQAVMKKRPKLTVLPTLESDQWRVFKLVKDQTLRHRAMNEIPQLMYQLTEAAMVESGLNDKVDNFESYTPRLTKTSSDLVLEKVDCNTTYVQYMKRWNAAPSQANVLYKRIMEPTRDVIVCRTVLEDELNPFPEGVLVMNKSTWVVLEKLDNGKACRMKFFQKSTLPMIQSSPDTQSHLDSDAWFEYYRVGTVSDSVMHSLKTMVTEFNGAITALLSNYNGNIDETFKKVIDMMDQES